MTASAEPMQTPGEWTQHLHRAFFLIIAGFILSTLVSIYEMRRTQAEVALIVQRALGSIELTSRLSRDLDRERLLFDAHVVETERVGMERIEKELSDAEARIATTARMFDTTINDDAERTVWQKLQGQISALRPKTKSVIDLSRQNLDAQARAALKAIEPEYDAVDRTMDTLVLLNLDRANRQVADIHLLQRIGLIILAALSVAGTAFACFVAKWVTRLIRQRENQLRSVTTQLEERNRELDAFAGRVAHDLRGPLTAINLAAFSKEGVSGERAVVEGANAVFRRGVKRMESIIDDLLTLSRISSQTITASCQTASVAASVEEDIRAKVEAVGGTSHVEVESATIPCNEGLLRQALWNLGENAVNYRRAGVPLKVEIRGRITPEAYEFRVSDNGAGMSPSEIQHAFEPFFRGERVRSVTSGTGLGLSIVRRVVEISGGSISVESAVGEGSVFTLTLPLAESKAA
jgi:signal transduction histidine kinase